MIFIKCYIEFWRVSTGGRVHARLINILVLCVAPYSPKYQQICLGSQKPLLEEGGLWSLASQTPKSLIFVDLSTAPPALGERSS